MNKYHFFPLPLLLFFFLFLLLGNLAINNMKTTLTERELALTLLIIYKYYHGMNLFGVRRVYFLLFQIAIA